MVNRKKEWCDEWATLSSEEQNIIHDVQRIIPVAVGSIASRLGLIVKVTTLDIGISGEIAPDSESESFRIRINRHEIRARQRFTLAHEVSHYLLHRDLIEDGIADTVLYRSQLSNAIEAQANRLAADILMPNGSIKSWLSENQNSKKRECVVPLAEFFQVSEDAMAIRLGLK